MSKNKHLHFVHRLAHEFNNFFKLHLLTFLRFSIKILSFKLAFPIHAESVNRTVIDITHYVICRIPNQ